MARILHGAVERDRALGRRTILLGLISALLHDTGYIKREDDRTGSGAKYTASHVLRGIDFSREYLPPRGYSPEDCDVCRSMLLCTGLDIGIGRIVFRSESDALAGRMLGTCDLMAQMARRNYLEKLPYLYRELMEGGVLRHGNEHRFIEETVPFCRSALDRLANNLGVSSGTCGNISGCAGGSIRTCTSRPSRKTSPAWNRCCGVLRGITGTG